MSDSFLERLKRFTPDGAGLDRDGLLFEMGRRSGRRRSWWPALTAILAVTQVVTLGFVLWRAPETVMVSPNPKESKVAAAAIAGVTPPQVDLSNGWLSPELAMSLWDKNDLAEPTTVDEVVTPETMLEMLDIDADLRGYLSHRYLGSH